MLGLFSSWKAVIEEGATEKEIKEISDYLYQQAQAEVDWKVDELKNPEKVIRGYASITELRKAVKTLIQQVNFLTEENKRLQPKEEKPF